MARLCSSVLILDYLHTGLFLSTHGFCCLDPLLLAFGLSRSDLLSFVLDMLHLELPFSSQTSMWLDSALLLYGCSVPVARHRILRG